MFPFPFFIKPQLKRKEGGRKAAFPLMEEKLVYFINNSDNPSKEEIIAKAKEIMKGLNEPMSAQFSYSKGWFDRFKERHFGRK